MGTAAGDDVERLVEAFMGEWRSPDELRIPGGYRDSAFSVIDAVFSIRLRYERVVDVLYTVAGKLNVEVVVGHLDQGDQFTIEDLATQLSDRGEQGLLGLFGARYKASGAFKASIVRQAAEALVRAGVTDRLTVRAPAGDGYAEQKAAWTGVHGLGPVTHDYFRMLNGHDAAKLDVMLHRWLYRVLDRTPGTWEGRELMADLTGRLQEEWDDPRVTQRSVDHTIWRTERAR